MSDSDEEFGVGPARPVSRRRRWSEAERLRIVAESYQPGVSVSLVARSGVLREPLEVRFGWS